MRFISIVTVTHNNLRGLQATQASLQSQTCQNFEWIVIDGDSSDGTKEHAATNRPATFVSEPDSGIYDAMNKGIDRASGDYILFLNAGDTLAAPETLERLLPFFDGAGFVYGDSMEDGHYKAARSHRRICLGMFTHHQSMLYHRKTIGALRYDTNYKIAADYKFTLLHLLHSVKITYCPFPICVFEPGGVSQTAARTGRIEQFCIREELDTCPRHLNAALYLAQTVWLALRRAMPGVYWAIKRG